MSKINVKLFIAYYFNTNNQIEGIKIVIENYVLYLC